MGKAQGILRSPYQLPTSVNAYTANYDTTGNSLPTKEGSQIVK